MNNSKYSKKSWWIFGIIGSILGLIFSDGDEVLMRLFEGLVNGVFYGWLIGILIDKLQSTNFWIKLSKFLGEQFERFSKLWLYYDSKLHYKHDKHHYQFLSNETLVKKYKRLKELDGSSIQRLAIEEELVKRRLLKFSPMHEKLEQTLFMKEQANEVRKSHKLLANKLNCKVEDIKSTYINSLKSDDCSFSELEIIEEKWVNKKKNEAQVLGLSIDNTPSAFLEKWTAEYKESFGYNPPDF